ncbi:hypothetical protein NE237_002443 [Protea cynaroides]|uniref:NAD-dependent epimerase/dehydratase domain-containing protein n=1 Tax=Protea cynaroides TaxID=273540 RepID=A0A9Q0QZC5_9MAGN|nr:hypothetical protein NE237_002443 [Protea cynaroides]
MATEAMETKRACVTGGTSYVASLLIKCLLEKGYAVNTTVRDPDNQKKISHLLELQNSGDLKIFQADLTDEGIFDVPVSGCDLVFHLATPVNFTSQDPENDMIKPAIQGTLNVLKACVKSKTVKRVVMTSSAATVSINKSTGTNLVMDEQCWTDVDFLASEKPPTWGYPVSKTLAEKAAWKFAEENKIDLVTIIPCLMAGPAITPNVPSSLCLAMSLLTGTEFLINGMKGMQMLSGSISFAHVEDVVRAHIFLAEKESASGRYICCCVNTSVPELAKFLNKRYPQYKVPTDFGEFPAKAKLIISSEKLVKEGFSFNYGIEEIYDQAEFLVCSCSVFIAGLQLVFGNVELRALMEIHSARALCNMLLLKINIQRTPSRLPLSKLWWVSYYPANHTASNGNNPDGALSMYRKMQRGGYSPDHFTFPFVLKAYALTNNQNYGMCVHDRIVKTGFESDLHASICTHPVLIWEPMNNCLTKFQSGMWYLGLSSLLVM